MFFDAHTHVHFAAFKDDWREAARRALDAGVGFVTVGTQRDISARAVAVAHEFEDKPVFASVGLHPIHTSVSFHDEEELGSEEATKGFTSRAELFDYEYYKKLARDPKVVAIGECGLDYYRPEAGAAGGEAAKKQKEAFVAQIALSNEIQKPLMVHCRDGKKSGTGKAFDDLIDVLKTVKPSLPFVSHSFVRDTGLAKKLLDLGSYFSFNGIITFAEDYAEVIRFLPADRILSETDAPYLSPVPHRGCRNEPAYVVEVVKKLADIRSVSPEEMKEVIWENTERIFGI